MNKADFQRALKTCGADPLITVLVYKEGSDEQLATIWVVQDVRYDRQLDRILIEVRD